MLSTRLKGRFHFRQFFPSKPGRLKIKAFTLAEPTSGYVLGSKVYTGKEVGVVEKDLGKKAVMSLMESCGQRYYLFMDNYYTSVGLFEELQERSTLACGTVRSNRVDLSREICNLKSRQVKQLKRGDSLYRQDGTLTKLVPRVFHLPGSHWSRVLVTNLSSWEGSQLTEYCSR